MRGEKFSLRNTSRKLQQVVGISGTQCPCVWDSDSVLRLSILLGGNLSLNQKASLLTQINASLNYYVTLLVFGS